MEFGIPKLRQKKVEKYNFPVLTICEVKEKGHGHKFLMNAAMVALLEFEEDIANKVSFAFEEGKTFMANTTSMDVDQVNVTKDKTFSNSRLHNYLCDILELDSTKTHELVVKTVPTNDYALVEVTTIKAEDYIDNVDDSNSAETALAENDLKKEEASIAVSEQIDRNHEEENMNDSSFE